MKKFSEEPRDRYIEDWEYDLVIEVALTTSYPWIAPMMEFAYLCRMRANEVLALREDKHLLEEGILVERSKGSVNEITGWTPRLQKAVDDARRLTNPDTPTRINDQPLFRGKIGAPNQENARKPAW